MKHTPPKALRSLPQWVNRQGPDGKIPRPPITGQLLSYEAALQRSEDVGWVFTKDDPYAGVDIDAINEFTRRVLDMARECGAALQLSLSGGGWHIIGRGHLERGIGKGQSKLGVEAYSSKRYFTVPDHRWDGNPDVDIQHILDFIAAAARDPHSIGEMLDTGAWLPEHVRLLTFIPADDYDTWLAVGMAIKAGDGSIEVWDQWSQTSKKYPGPAALRAKWDSFRGSGIGIGTVRHLAREGGWDEGAEAVEMFDVLPQPVNEPAESAALDGFWERLALDPDEAATLPPPREWAWDQWVPYGVVTGLSGPPGVAKSTFALQLAVHHCLGVALYGQVVGEGPAVFITVEDDGPELRRRFASVAAGLMLEADEVPGLTLVPAVDARVDLVEVDARTRSMKASEKLKALRAWLRVKGARLVVLDLVGDFWDGNENSRSEVAGFVRSYLGRMATQLQCAVVAVTHLNKQGGVMGSVAWVGSFRSAMQLERSGEQLHLSRTKANYAPPLSEPVVLEWRDGYLYEVPQADLEEVVEDEELMAVVPLEWTGVRRMARVLGVPEAGVHEVMERLLDAYRGTLHRRVHGGRPQWRRVEGEGE